MFKKWEDQEMTRNNRESMQRAIGIIEGVSWGASQRVIDALSTAAEILDAILNDKEEGATDERT
jgi:hypothetical protein